MLRFLFGVLIMAAMAAATIKSTAVAGRLFCNGKVVPNLPVRLIEHEIFRHNDVLSRDKTGPLGDFALRGRDNDFYHDFRLRIGFVCGEGEAEQILKCHEIRVPNTYYSFGYLPDHVYDLGDIALEKLEDNCY